MSNSRVECRLYVLQRSSGLLLAPLVAAHLATMIYAARGGLSAAEILSRTQSSVGWSVLYATMVLLAAVHGAIGLRAVARELTAWHGPSLDLTALVYAIVVLVLGSFAVAAIS